MIQSYSPKFYDEICRYLEQEEKEGNFDTIRYLLQDRRCDILGKPPEERSGPFLNRN